MVVAQVVTGLLVVQPKTDLTVAQVAAAVVGHKQPMVVMEHLDKEMRFASQKREVKVLSLFFIDSVEFYRQYDEDGNPVKGKYALMFEEEYRKLARQPAYQTLFQQIDLDIEAAEVHDGYFSIDKNKKFQEPTRKAGGDIADNAANRENAERAYNLIMKEKEKG